MKPHFLAAMVLLAASPAAAYTSYILPSDFSPDPELRLEAAFASTFFTPAVGVSADMQLLYPDGADFLFDRVEASPTMTSASARLRAPGTYRITTGEDLGPVSTLVAENGDWRPLGAGETPPPEAQTTTIQAVTLADAYVSVGAPTRQVVDRTIGTLALRPITHPNQVLAAEGLVVELLFNGAPFANMPIVLYEQGDADADVGTFFVTDASGRATITVGGPGHYVIAARHRGDAPPGAAAAVRSYTTTLTFEALTALPDYPPPPREERRRRRRDE